MRNPFFLLTLISSSFISRLPCTYAPMHHLSCLFLQSLAIHLSCLSVNVDPVRSAEKAPCMCTCVRVCANCLSVCLSVHPSVPKPNQVKLANSLLPRCLGGGRTRKPYHARDLLPHHASLPLFWPRYALNRTRLLHESGV